jgi:hypothetical protein
MTKEIALDTWIRSLSLPPVLVPLLTPAPFPGFDPKAEAERRGFYRPLPESPRP